MCASAMREVREEAISVKHISPPFYFGVHWIQLEEGRAVNFGVVISITRSLCCKIYVGTAVVGEVFTTVTFVSTKYNTSLNVISPTSV